MLSAISPRARAIWGIFFRRLIYRGAKIIGVLGVVVAKISFPILVVALHLLCFIGMLELAYGLDGINLLAGVGCFSWFAVLCWAINMFRFSPELIKELTWGRPFCSLLLLGSNGAYSFVNQLSSDPLSSKPAKPFELTFYQRLVLSKSTPMTFAGCMAPSLDGFKLGWSYVRATLIITLYVLNFLLSLGAICALLLPALVELFVLISFDFIVKSMRCFSLKAYVDELASESGEATARVEAAELSGQIKAGKSAPRRHSL